MLDNFDIFWFHIWIKSLKNEFSYKSNNNIFIRLHLNDNGVKIKPVYKNY